MLKSGMDAEVATICGDMKVGYESDLVLATQLENVLELVRPDRVVLVSDGAEDEFIYPMVSSRVKIDSVRRVFVKQAPTVEGTYYIIMKMLRDDKIRKRLVTPIGLVLAVFGLLSLAPKLIQFYDTSNFGLISEMAVGSISLVLGIYVIAFAYKVVERFREFSRKAGRAIRSGSQMIPFAILSIVLFFLGIVYGLDAARADPQASLLIQVLLFVSGTIWAWVFSLISYQIGRFVNHFLSQGKIYSTYLVVSITVFAIGFIIQGALDASEFFLGYRTYKEITIVLEMLAGFLLAVFGGLLSTSLRSIASGSDKSIDKVDVIDLID
jgi:putative membrane protein